LFLGGLESLLRHERGFEVVASDLDGLAAVESIRQHKPEIGVLDIRMPGLNRLQIVEVLRQEKLPTKISPAYGCAHGTTDRSGTGVRHMGILLKTAAADTLVRCLTNDPARDVSSADEAAIETRQTGASWL
jgi:DNA-binding NarL/FixJ family response regulator